MMDARLGLLRWQLDQPGTLVTVFKEDNGLQAKLPSTTMVYLKALENRPNVLCLDLTHLRGDKPEEKDLVTAVWRQAVGDHPLQQAFAPSLEYNPALCQLCLFVMTCNSTDTRTYVVCTETL
jgi:hypothetical protein